MLILEPGTQPSRAQSLRVLLLSSIVLGLVGAAIQVSVQLGNALVLGRLVFTSRDVVWMAPLSWMGFMLLMAIPFALGALLLPRLNWALLSLVALTLTVVLVLLAPFGAIATWAASVVGLGVSVQVARMAPTTSPQWAGRLGRMATWLGAAFVLASLGSLATRSVAETRAIASLPAADSTAPNVILVVFDVVRAANLSAYGYQRPTTPILEGIAREGTTFDHAYAVAPWTLPSHASMFTGRYPTELHANYRRGLEDGIPTLAESFRERGYRTAGFTGNAVYTGWDAKLLRGFERWRDYARTWDQVRYGGLPWQVSKIGDFFSSSTLQDAWTALRYVPLRSPTNLSFDQKRSMAVRDEFLSWQSTVPRERPFFAFINFYDAHRPRYAPPEITRKFDSGVPRIDRYDAAIAFIDQQLGVVMDSLKARGELDNTVIAIVGDHGELLGEHEFVGHSNMVYRDLLWVPFLLRYPGHVAAGVHVPGAVSLRDIGATLIDVSRGRIPPGFGGASLATAAAAGAPADASPVFSYAHKGENLAPRFPNATGPLFSIVLDSLHYIRHPKEELLFDMQRDSGEVNNLAADPRFAPQLEMARRLVDSLKALTPR